MMMMVMMMRMMSILTSASSLCFLLFLFIYSSLSTSISFLHYNHSYSPNVSGCRSEWAPVCIGPYAQCNVSLQCLAMVAGQIGLVPATMLVVGEEEYCQLGENGRDSDSGDDKTEGAAIVSRPPFLSPLMLRIASELILSLRHIYKILTSLEGSDPAAGPFTPRDSVHSLVFVSTNVYNKLMRDAVGDVGDDNDSQKEEVEHMIKQWTQRFFEGIDVLAADTMVDGDSDGDSDEDDDEDGEKGRQVAVPVPVAVLWVSSLPRDVLIETEVQCVNGSCESGEREGLGWQAWLPGEGKEGEREKAGSLKDVVMRWPLWLHADLGRITPTNNDHAMESDGAEVNAEALLSNQWPDVEANPNPKPTIARTMHDAKNGQGGTVTCKDSDDGNVGSAIPGCELKVYGRSVNSCLCAGYIQLPPQANSRPSMSLLLAFIECSISVMCGQLSDTNLSGSDVRRVGIYYDASYLPGDDLGSVYTSTQSLLSRHFPLLPSSPPWPVSLVGTHRGLLFTFSAIDIIQMKTERWILGAQNSNDSSGR